MFAFESDSSARASAPRLRIGVVEPGRVMVPLIRPMFRPGAAVARLVAVPRMLALVDVLKLVPPMTCVLVELTPLKSCHWMPNSAALSVVTSTTRASMNTCMRRASSLSMTERSEL